MASVTAGQVKVEEERTAAQVIASRSEAEKRLTQESLAQEPSARMAVYLSSLELWRTKCRCRNDALNFARPSLRSR